MYSSFTELLLRVTRGHDITIILIVPHASAHGGLGDSGCIHIHAVCCTHCNTLQHTACMCMHPLSPADAYTYMQCAAMCCCELLCCLCKWTLGVGGCMHIHAVCCRFLQCVAMCCYVLLCCFCKWTLGVGRCIRIQAVCYTVLQCVAVCCSVL